VVYAEDSSRPFREAKERRLGRGGGKAKLTHKRLSQEGFENTSSCTVGEKGELESIR